MKQPFSMLSDADCYSSMNGTRTQYDTTNCQEVYTNDYMSRSDIPDNISEKKHILFLGDSFVFGHKILRHETISAHFDKMLNNDDYCVVNLGVNGSSLELAMIRLQQWQNTFPNNIHSVYLGISGAARSTHWISSVGSLDNNTYSSTAVVSRFNFVVNAIPPKVNIEEYSIQKHATTLISKVNCLANVDSRLMNLKYLANANNFNVYTFITIDDMLIEEEHDTLKSHLEKDNSINFIYKKFDDIAQEIHDLQVLKARQNLSQSNYFLPCRHYNSDGCNEVAKIFIDETSGWY